jgi:hypothetical protein
LKRRLFRTFFVRKVLPELAWMAEETTRLAKSRRRIDAHRRSSKQIPEEAKKIPGARTSAAP